MIDRLGQSDYFRWSIVKSQPILPRRMTQNTSELCSQGWSEIKTVLSWARVLFLESPETFRAHFGWHNSLCIFKTKASRGTKLCSYFYFYSLYNIWEDQLYRMSRPELDEWLFGLEKLSGLSRNRPQARQPFRKEHGDFVVINFPILLFF